MTEEQYTEAIAIHSRLEALQEAKKHVNNSNNYKLGYKYRMPDNSYREVPE